MAEDISQYKIEIENLRKENAKLEAYLNNLVQIIPASVYWKDVNSVILGDNLLHSKIAGLKCNEDAVGKTDYDFIWKNQAARIIENDKMIMHSKQGLKLEEEATLIDGKIHTFLTSKEPMFDKNKIVIGIIGVSLDIADSILKCNIVAKVMWPKNRTQGCFLVRNDLNHLTPDSASQQSI